MIGSRLVDGGGRREKVAGSRLVDGTPLAWFCDCVLEECEHEPDGCEWFAESLVYDVHSGERHLCSACLEVWERLDRAEA